MVLTTRLAHQSRRRHHPNSHVLRRPNAELQRCPWQTLAFFPLGAEGRHFSPCKSPAPTRCVINPRLTCLQLSSHALNSTTRHCRGPISFTRLAPSLNLLREYALLIISDHFVSSSGPTPRLPGFHPALSSDSSRALQSPPPPCVPPSATTSPLRQKSFPLSAFL